MITQKIYESIMNIKERLHDFDDKRPTEIYLLQQKGFLARSHYEKEGRCVTCWVLTDKAYQAIEEYEKSLREESREIESLKVARSARNWSIAAVVVSTLASIAAILVSCLVE